MDWGLYARAIRRWELILGRPAPVPTEPGKNGQRLSARFVEWMQGLDDGWVTDVPGLSRSDMLRILGNGVVPQQFSAAIRILLDRAFGAFGPVLAEPLHDDGGERRPLPLGAGLGG